MPGLLEEPRDDIENELQELGIDVDIEYSPEWREGPNVVCYENLTVIFKNQDDLNLYRAVGKIKEDKENIIFDVLM